MTGEAPGRDMCSCGCGVPLEDGERLLDVSDPYDEDGYCDWCGNGRWKHHAPDCEWADHRDHAPQPAENRR